MNPHDVLARLLAEIDMAAAQRETHRLYELECLTRQYRATRAQFFGLVCDMEREREARGAEQPPEAMRAFFDRL